MSELEQIKQALAEVLDEREKQTQTMSIAEVCDYLHITRMTLWRNIQNGRYSLTPRRVGRRTLFVRSEVEKLVI